MRPLGTAARRHFNRLVKIMEAREPGSAERFAPMLEAAAMPLAWLEQCDETLCRDGLSYEIRTAAGNPVRVPRPEVRIRLVYQRLAFEALEALCLTPSSAACYGAGEGSDDGGDRPDGA